MLLTVPPAWASAPLDSGPAPGDRDQVPRASLRIEVAAVVSESSSDEPAEASSDRPVHDFYRPTTGNLRLRNTALLTTVALGVAYYGATQWWSTGLSLPFHTGNEGWFGQNTEFGGADKVGHMYATYAGTRLLARGLELLGNPENQALKIGAWFTLGAYTAIEIADGFSEEWTFSAQDEIMNVVGVGLGVLLETNPKLDRILDFRLLYWPSSDAQSLGKFGPASDYSGDTFLLVAKAAGVPKLADKGLLRYLELAVGYGTRGYQPNLGGEKSRHVYVGISLNLAEVLDRSVFRRKPDSWWRKGTDFFLELVQIPGTAALADIKL